MAFPPDDTDSDHLEELVFQCLEAKDPLGLQDVIVATYGVNRPFWQSSRRRLHGLYTKKERPNMAACYANLPPKNPTKGRQDRK